MEIRCMGCMEQFDSEFSVCPHCGYVVGTKAEEAIHIAPGTLLHNRYFVGKVLGYGGFGVTYIGWDGKLEQKVAIKEYLHNHSQHLRSVGICNCADSEKGCAG